MGVDACLFFTTKNEISAEELLKMSHDLYEAYWGSPFFLYERDAHIITARSHKEYVDYFFDGEPLNKKVHLYEVALMGRFYGVDYERGDLPTIISICEWIEFHVPECQIYYGGDCSSEYDLFNSEERDLLKLHFLEHGHRPYRGGSLMGHSRATCERCRVLMSNNGGGGDENFESCLGCDEKAITSRSTGEVLKRWRGDEDFFKAMQELRAERK